MPYSVEHKAQTRARIIESARIMFNRHGFEQVSIDDVMKQAGLTRGGFYHHFSSKDDLYAESVNSFITCNPFASRQAEAEKPISDPRKLANMLVEVYLSDETLADVDRQCPLVALPSDVARAGLKPRQAYTQLVDNMLHVFRSAFPKSDRDAPRKAMLIVNLCVGGMIIARTTDDPTLRKTLRATARSEAKRMLRA